MRERPRRRVALRRALLALAALVVVASGVVALQRVGQLENVLRRAEHANPALLALAVVLEIFSFAGYVVMTRVVFGPVAPRVSWSASVQITLAGVAATRLLATGGVGGIALTAWVLRAAGLDSRTTARRLGAQLVLIYSVFFATLGLDATALAIGLLQGEAPQALAVAGVVLSAVVAAAATAAALVRRPAVVSDAVRLGARILRLRRSAAPAALAWWAFDIAVLWAAVEMYGTPPAVSALVLCYFVGQVAQTIPAPGGIGPVEGGMVGALAACGVSVALAVIAVLTYRAISTWLPALSGIWAYVRLRRTVAGWRTADDVSPPAHPVG